MVDPPKEPAIEANEKAGKRLSEITAAEFLELLEQRVGASGQQAATGEATVRDALAGAAAASRWVPEKKKVELELPEKKKVEREFPEKKKVELELPEKKKVELEKTQLEGVPEKKKVELEKQMPEDVITQPADLLGEIRSVSERLTKIEQQIAKGQGQAPQ
jgi:hypothetical protein